MALRRRVRALGRIVVIGSALAATFLVFAAVAVQVAVRARGGEDLGQMPIEAFLARLRSELPAGAA